MARNNSFIKLEGTLDGLTFYEKDGQSFVKTKSSVSKNRIAKDPAFRRTRENMQEFGGAAKAGKAFRTAFSSIVKLMSDTYFSARLTGLMKRINRNGTGIRGERVIDILSNGALLEGLEFNLAAPLSAQFFAPFADPSWNANRDVATWTVPDFDTDSFVRAPESATHIRLVLAAGLVSSYEWETALQSYEPFEEAENGLGGVAFSADIPLTGLVGGDTILSVDLGLGAAIPVTTAAIASVGIVFYQEINGDLYELAQGNAMQVAVVS